MHEEKTLALIQRAHPGIIHIDSAAVARLAGITPASIRTLRCAGKFGLAAIDKNNRLYDIREVADWLDRRNAKSNTQKKKRGARTKVERAAEAVAAQGGSAC